LVGFGGYQKFEVLVKTLVGVMAFSILVCAVLTFSDPVGVVQGSLVPTVPEGGGMYVLSLIGGIGGSITMLGYNYWMREEGISGEGHLRYVRGDVGIAYVFTAMFGMAIMLIANQAFFLPGVEITDAQAVPLMAETLGSILGPFGAWAYSIGFWAAVFASLLGVWQSVPYLYADFYGIVKRLSPEARREVVQVTSTPYRLALLWVSLVPIPFAFTGRPIAVIVTYTIVGSLFVPFLAATLLYMNSGLNRRATWSQSVPRNHWATNALLVVILALFLVVGGQEVLNAIR
jgi:Mn2+/Fe2+ NRAMP family transporter